MQRCDEELLLYFTGGSGRSSTWFRWFRLASSSAWSVVGLAGAGRVRCVSGAAKSPGSGKLGSKIEKSDSNLSQNGI
jgi:hypothetical protein